MTVPRCGAVIVLAALVAAGCGGGTKPSAATTATTSPSAAASTTTTEAPVPPVTGTDDQAVQKRLTNAATLELTLYTDATKFSADVPTLQSVDNTLKFVAGLTPPTDPTIVAVAVSADAQWACLTGKSAAGHVLVVAVGPSIDVYGGSGPFRACTASAAHALRRING